MLQTLEQLKSGQLNGVKHLNLVANLTHFPMEILALADSLEVLDLSNNLLESLPTDFACLKNLKIVFLSNNKFKTLPSVLAKCAKLEMIGIKANQLTSVPENSLPEQTRWLILTDNNIAVLPNSMGQLSRLQKLALAGNKIKRLPDSMKNCKSLELVRLSANQLTQLPNWFFQLPKLAWCAFAGNPMFSDSPNKNSTMVKVNSTDITLGKQLGEGASGVIYQGKWLNQPHTLKGQSKDIAVKLFKGELTTDGYPIDELNTCLTAGEHKNLIKVVAQIAQTDQLGLVMELIPDNYFNLGLPPTLETCTRDTFKAETQFALPDICKISLAMSDTLAHLHKKGVSHGDIYAHNTMINNSCSVLFGDFGASSNLNTLPTLQKEAMEAIEVRAFGYLLEDMLSVSKKDQACNSLKAELTSLKAHCLQLDHGVRPTFSEINTRLMQLLKYQQSEYLNHNEQAIASNKD